MDNQQTAEDIDSGRRLLLKAGAVGAIYSLFSGSTSAQEGKSLPDNADGDNSVVIENDQYQLDVGESESGTWIWPYIGTTTLFHEFFALQEHNGTVVPSYMPSEVVEYFSDEVGTDEPARAVLDYIINGTTLRIDRVIVLDSNQNVFTIRYRIRNIGDVPLEDLNLYQHCDYDIGGSGGFTEDRGEYVENPELVYITGGGSGSEIYTGFLGEFDSDEHHVGAYPAYDPVLSGNLNNEDAYPSTGFGDPVVVLQWGLGDLPVNSSTEFTVYFGVGESLSELKTLLTRSRRTPEDNPNVISGKVVSPNGVGLPNVKLQAVAPSKESGEEIKRIAETTSMDSPQRGYFQFDEFGESRLDDFEEEYGNSILLIAAEEEPTPSGQGNRLVAPETDRLFGSRLYSDFFEDTDSGEVVLDKQRLNGPKIAYGDDNENKPMAAISLWRWMGPDPKEQVIYCEITSLNIPGSGEEIYDVHGVNMYPDALNSGLFSLSFPEGSIDVDYGAQTSVELFNPDPVSVYSFETWGSSHVAPGPITNLHPVREDTPGGIPTYETVGKFQGRDNQYRRTSTTDQDQLDELLGQGFNLALEVLPPGVGTVIALADFAVWVGRKFDWDMESYVGSTTIGPMDSNTHDSVEQGWQSNSSEAAVVYSVPIRFKTNDEIIFNLKGSYVKDGVPVGRGSFGFEFEIGPHI